MKYVAGYSEIDAGAYNIPVHTIYEYAEVVKELDAYNEANDALTIQLAALQAKLSAAQAGWKKCEGHLKIVATEFLESVDEEFIPREDRTQTTFEDAVKVARQALIHQASKVKP